MRFPATIGDLGRTWGSVVVVVVKILRVLCVFCYRCRTSFHLQCIHVYRGRRLIRSGFCTQHWCDKNCKCQRDCMGPSDWRAMLCSEQTGGGTETEQGYWEPWHLYSTSFSLELRFSSKIWMFSVLTYFKQPAETNANTCSFKLSKNLNNR